MPWLIRLGLSIAGELLGEDSLQKLVVLAGALVFLLMAVVLSLPALVMHVPLVTAEGIDVFYKAAGEISEMTRTGDDPRGITIPWEEVTATWAVLYQQDYSKADMTKVREFVWNWVERHDQTGVGDGVRGNTQNKIHTWYSLRVLNGVMDVLKFTGEQRELTRVYLEAIREGGAKPPAGWRARPVFGWIWPVPGYDTADVITSPYGSRIHPITNLPEIHLGVDIAAPEGVRAIAARAGTVSGTGRDPSLGQYVAIQCGGYENRYGHLSAILVQEGEKVESGQVIGRVGSTGLSTGPHLDFRVRFAGQWLNPLQFY